MNHTSHKKSKVANAILLSLLSVTSTVTATSALAPRHKEISKKLSSKGIFSMSAWNIVRFGWPELLFKFASTASLKSNE